MKASRLTSAFGLMVLSIVLTSYTVVQTVQADVCLSCIGDRIKQKTQDIQNNPNIPEPHKNQIVSKLNEKITVLQDLARCVTFDPNDHC